MTVTEILHQKIDELNAYIKTETDDLIRYRCAHEIGMVVRIIEDLRDICADIVCSDDGKVI